ncbi:MAG TPA: hypothetical protein VNT23_04105, partial [Gaiellaceae bacterium]|nr:hypothetical protein [Gaiellaceae bacterium]
GVSVPPGGTRECLVRPGPDFVSGAVVVRADLPVLPFGVVPEASGPGHAWQLDWYPFCPEHVGGCDG